MNDVIRLTGAPWRDKIDEIIERERVAIGFGPYERDWLTTKYPERVQRNLELARRRPDLVAVNQAFAAPVGQASAPPTSFTAINTTNTETDLWNPGQAIWTPIPANTMQTGQMYKISGGGIFSTSSAAPTALWTPRSGQGGNGVGVALGASTAVTMIASLASVPFYFEFTLVIRALGLAASGAAGTGNGFVCIGGLTVTPGIIQVVGATIASTIDNTAASGLKLAITWGTNAAANSVQCQWVTPVRSYN